MALVDILLIARFYLDKMVASTEVSAFFQTVAKQNHYKLIDIFLLASANFNTPTISKYIGTALQIAVEKGNLQRTQ
jgi:hypothetical protein